MSFEVESQRDDVDEYLREVYGSGLTNFEFSLRNIMAFYSLIDLKQKETLFRERINVLETEKILLIENIDDFLTKTKLWDEIKKNQIDTHG